MNTNIENKVIVITGASSGLGEAMARKLASQGASVVLGARRVEKLNAIVADIKNENGHAVALATDVTKAESVKALVDLAVTTFGRADVMINNAGIMPLSPLSALKVQEWNDTIDVNIKGVLNGIAAALPVFEQQETGHFINLASVAGHKVSPASSVYAGTKFAVRAISEGLRMEVGRNIRTTVISPGLIDSELKHGSSDATTSQFVNEVYKDAISATSIANAVAYVIEQPEVVK
ncbi:SDR family oxidoreductase [Vibrio lentus]|uniref:Oxidoreductase n=1 Tax=Vibrio lentus TaxID=136468 RepID=A0A2N7JVJ1_9VIBR|nr:SDR family oxidoreductase [Vibrio lentus]PMM63609.1 oxidoreductase [Vibrio lentus]